MQAQRDISRYIVMMFNVPDIIRKITPDDFFVWMQTFYRLCGLLPPKSGFFRYMYISLATSYFSLLVLSLFSQWYVISTQLNEKGLERMILQITWTMFSNIFHFRIIMWMVNYREMSHLVHLITRSSFNFECFSISRVKSDVVYRNIRQKEIESQDVPKYYSLLSSFWSSDGIFHSEHNK